MFKTAQIHVWSKLTTVFKNKGLVRFLPPVAVRLPASYTGHGGRGAQTWGRRLCWTRTERTSGGQTHTTSCHGLSCQRCGAGVHRAVSHQIITCAYLMRDEQPGAVLFLDRTVWVLQGQETHVTHTLYAYSTWQQWVHPSHFSKHFIISSHGTIIDKELIYYRVVHVQLVNYY